MLKKENRKLIALITVWMLAYFLIITAIVLKMASNMKLMIPILIVISIVFFALMRNILNMCIFQKIDAIANKIDSDNGEENGKMYGLKELNELVERTLESYKSEQEKNTELSEDNSRFERYNSFLKMIQDEMFEKTRVYTIENDYFRAYGDIRSVGEYAGDFNDCYKIGTNRYFFTLASVMERNVAAFLYMMYAKLMLRDNSNFGLSPDEVLDITNNKLVLNNNGSMFVRALISEYNSDTRMLRYSSASGVIPYIVRKSTGEIQSLEQEKRYMPIGAWEDTEYELSETKIEEGDILVLYNKHSVSENMESELISIDNIRKVVEYIKTKREQNENSDVIELIKSKVLEMYAANDDKALMNKEYSIVTVLFK